MITSSMTFGQSGLVDKHYLDDKPKTSKHMMERKRRARINDSLLQLKSLVFPAIRKEICRQPKMEKADILEMTVRYLKEVQSPDQQGTSAATATGNISQYHAGYSECLGEASNFLAKCDGIDLDTRLLLMNHLADRCSSLPDPTIAAYNTDQQQQQQQQLHDGRSGHCYQPSPSSVALTTSSNTRVPPTTYVTHHPQQELLLCIPPPQDHTVAPSSQTPLSLLSSQSSVLFPTPPPSPNDVAQQQYTRVAPSPRVSKSHYKVKSAMALSYRRRHHDVMNAPAHENVWRPW